MSGRNFLEDHDQKRWEAFNLHAAGLTTKEIAAQFGVSTRTIQRMISEQMKMNRAEREGKFYSDLEKSLASLERVKAECWARIEKFKEDSTATNVTGLLNTISQTEERIMRVKGMLAQKAGDEESNVTLNLTIMKEALDRVNKKK